MSDAGGAVWAWWSKPPGSARDYEVLASNAGEAELGALDAEISQLGAGNPNREAPPGRALPWAAFAGLPGEPPAVRILWWDWTGTRDADQRDILGLLYLRVPAAGRPSIGALAEHARRAWAIARDGGAPGLPDPATGERPPDLAPWFGQPEPLQWIVTIAALAIVRPVRIVHGEDRFFADVPSRALLFDAIAAVLPAGVHARLTLASWLSNPGSNRYRIALSRQPDEAEAWDAERGPVAVRWGTMPDLSAHPEVRRYCDTLHELRSRHSLEAILAHLARHAEVPAALDVPALTACIDYLNTIDVLYTTGLDLADGRAVALTTVRGLLRTQRLDGLPPRIRLAYLRFLLERGTPDDVATVAANWHGDALPVMVEAALLRAGDDETGDLELRRWLGACVAIPVAARPDDSADLVLTAMLEAGRADGGPAQRLAEQTLRVLHSVVAPAKAGFDAAHGWLLDPHNERWAFSFIGMLAPDGWLDRAWLAWLDDSRPAAPGWLQLLHAATGGPRTATHGRPVNGRWLLHAERIARAHGREAGFIASAMADLLAHLRTGSDQDDGTRLWLRDVAAAEPQQRARVDFLLLCGDDRVPPGLLHGSALVHDPDYVLELLLQAENHPADREGFRRGLTTALASTASTAGALDLLNAMLDPSEADDQWAVDAAVTVARHRPELLDAEAPGPLWRRMLRAAPYLEQPAVLRRLRYEIETGGAAAVPRIGALLRRAQDLGCPGEQLRAELKHWAGRYNHQHLKELMGELGSPDGGTRISGFHRLVELLPPEDGRRFAGQLRERAHDDADEHRRRIAELREQITKLSGQAAEQDRVAAMCDAYLNPAAGPATERIRLGGPPPTPAATAPPARSGPPPAPLPPAPLVQPAPVPQVPPAAAPQVPLVPLVPAARPAPLPGPAAHRLSAPPPAAGSPGRLKRWWRKVRRRGREDAQERGSQPTRMAQLPAGGQFRGEQGQFWDARQRGEQHRQQGAYSPPPGGGEGRR